MSCIIVITSIILTFFETYLIYAMLRLFSHPRKMSEFKKIGIQFVGVTMLYLHFFIEFPPYVNSLVLLLVITLFQTILMHLNSFQIVWGVIIIVINTISEVIAYYILMTTQMDLESSFVTEVFFLLAIFLRFLVYICMKSVILNRTLGFSTIVFLAIFFVVLVYLLIYYVWASKKISQLFLVCIVVLMSCNFFILLRELLFEKNKNEKLQLSSRNILHKEFLSESYNKSYENFHKMIHNQNRILLNSLSSIDQKENQDLVFQLERIMHLSNICLINSRISDLYLDLVLNYFDQFFISNEVTIKKIIDLSSSSNFFENHSSQISLITLLEIGIEVSKVQLNKEIKLRVFEQQNSCVINMVCCFEEKNYDVEKVSSDVLFLKQIEKNFDVFLNIDESDNRLDICVIYSKN